MRRAALLSLLAGLMACQGFMDPSGGVTDRYRFESPVQVVLFVYQNLDAGRYRQMTLPFLEYTDKRPWLAWAERGEDHPWVGDEQAQVRVVALNEHADGRVEIVAEETWTGGQRRRAFLCEDTPDGWRIVDVDGEPGDGLLP